MKIDIQIVRGTAAQELLDESDFICQWSQLACEDPKVTIIQEPPFVISWYKQYSDHFEPILILGHNSTGLLVGLMPLAVSLSNKYLTHAGGRQAEYHGWICRPDDCNDFLIQALIAIKKNFRLKFWQWKSIPPRSDISWLKSDILKKEKIYVKYYTEDSPILDLNDKDKLNNLKRYRSNQINRYIRKGNFRLERIKSKERAIEIFDILAKQCDFRQMAAHQSMPFANDRNKKKFFIERMNYPENNHFTILWSGNNVLSFHFGPCDSDTVYLGLTGYNPIEEKNSPGSVLIVKLAEHLKQEGYRYLDLTIGGMYKEKYSNLHQKLYFPTIFFSRKDKIIADIKSLIWNSVKAFISNVGLQPKTIAGKLKVFIKDTRKTLSSEPSAIAGTLLSLIFKKEVYMLYKLNIVDYHVNDMSGSEPVAINNYPDLLLSPGSRTTDYKKELLRKALRHFCQEDLLYTVIRDGELAQYGWMSKGGACQRPVETMQFDTPANSFILNDFFTEKKHKKEELFTSTVMQMIKDSRKKGATEVYFPVKESDSSERLLIEKSGFKIHHKYRKTRIFWFVNKDY